MKLLDLILGILLHVLAQAVLYLFLQSSMASRRALRTETFAFSASLALFHQLLAALLGKRRDRDTDNLTVVLGSDAEIGIDDGLLSL